MARLVALYTVYYKNGYFFSHFPLLTSILYIIIYLFCLQMESYNMDTYIKYNIK